VQVDKSKLILGAFCVILAIALVAMVQAWYKERFKVVIPQQNFVEVEKIKYINKIKKVEVPIEKIVTYEKKVIVKKVNGLPTWFVDNADEQAIATANLPETKGGYEVIGTMNTATGVGNIIAKEKPRSLLGFPNEKEIGARVGYSSKLVQEVSVYGRWNFFRVGNIHLSAYAEGNSDNNATAQIEMGYRF
jgi:hypothetical protein